MEGFTLSLALVDAVPVLLFGASIIMTASKFGSPLFIIGASLSTLAGCCKVLWKLILGTSKKDVNWLNKSFVPLQSAGFLLMLISFVLGFKKINRDGVWRAATSMPALLFFLLWIAFMVLMVWYRKNRFRNDDAKSNWTAQFINCAAQASLFLAILFSK